MKQAQKRRKTSVPSRKIRYAVVGLGHIAQNAMLPAFAHAGSNSQLVALVSGDKEKLVKLGRKYHMSALYSYGQYDECLASETVDAVYIALPNSLHLDYAVRAAKAGVHVLCEKPLAVTAQEWSALRYRYLLYQRRTVSVSRRAHRSVRGCRKLCRHPLRRGRRNGERRDALSG